MTDAGVELMRLVRQDVYVDMMEYSLKHWVELESFAGQPLKHKTGLLNLAPVAKAGERSVLAAQKEVRDRHSNFVRAEAEVNTSLAARSSTCGAGCPSTP